MQLQPQQVIYAKFAIIAAGLAIAGLIGVSEMQALTHPAASPAITVSPTRAGAPTIVRPSIIRPASTMQPQASAGLSQLVANAAPPVAALSAQDAQSIYDTQFESQREGIEFVYMSTDTPNEAVAERASRLQIRAAQIARLTGKLRHWKSGKPPALFTTHYAGLHTELSLLRAYLSLTQGLDRSHPTPFQVSCNCGYRTMCYSAAEWSATYMAKIHWLTQRGHNNDLYQRITGSSPIDEGSGTDWPVAQNSSPC